LSGEAVGADVKELLSMLAYEDALAFAKKHLEVRPPPPAGWVWKLPEGQRVADGWYFDYAADRLTPTDGPGSGFGGAPGFLVFDDGEVRPINWPEYTRVIRGGRL
jgi:hypothetical protein